MYVCMYVCMYAEAEKPPKFLGGLNVVAMYCGVSILGIVSIYIHSHVCT